MNYTQAITPNPDIPCKPGWCLAYVNEAFGVPKKFGSATDAWNGSTTQHTDINFPSGVWLPLWFSLATEPAGHVALRAPDGSVYSTSNPYGTTPRHHPNLADLIYVYSFDNPLTYLGWTEDVEGTPVITNEDVMTPDAENTLFTVLDDVHTKTAALPDALYWDNLIKAVARIDTASAESILRDIPDNLAQQVLDGLSARLAAK